MKYFILPALFTCLLFQSCEKHRLNKLQAGWLIITPSDTAANAPENYQYIAFECDEFRMVKQLYRDNTNNPGCTNNSAKMYDEYIKGAYEIDGKTLSLKGTYMDDTFLKTKEKDCESYGEYQKKFSWKIKKGMLILIEAGNSAEWKFSKVKDIKCD